MSKITKIGGDALNDAQDFEDADSIDLTYRPGWWQFKPDDLSTLGYLSIADSLSQLRLRLNTVGDLALWADLGNA